MQAANKVLKACKNGSQTFGAWQMLPGVQHSRMMASRGYDWICVDTEHGNIDDSAMHDAVTAIASCQVSPIVRIPANEGWMVKRALDAGAHGIIVPLLNTPDDAKKLVLSTKFPPLGQRGYGSPFPMDKFSSTLTGVDYLKQANESLLTIVQIETKEALLNVDAIARTPGIDVLFVGPFDLGNSIGHPIVEKHMAEELKTAIATVLKAAKAANKASGIYATSGQQAREFADQGFQMISVVGDVIVLSSGLSDHLTAAKGSLAHSAFQMASHATSRLTGPYGK